MLTLHNGVAFPKLHLQRNEFASGGIDQMKYNAKFSKYMMVASSLTTSVFPRKDEVNA